MKMFPILSAMAFGLAMVMSPAVTANASEPIAIEPKGEETVKACEKYGPGFVYIPGTETCVKISGSIRTTYTAQKQK